MLGVECYCSSPQPHSCPELSSTVGKCQLEQYQEEKAFHRRPRCCVSCCLLVPGPRRVSSGLSACRKSRPVITEMLHVLVKTRPCLAPASRPGSICLSVRSLVPRLLSRGVPATHQFTPLVVLQPLNDLHPTPTTSPDHVSDYRIMNHLYSWYRYIPLNWGCDYSLIFCVLCDAFLHYQCVVVCANTHKQEALVVVVVS